MSAKASTTTQDLHPLQYEPLRFIPVGDARELPPLVGWAAWDRAVAEIDALDVDRPEFASRRAALHFLR